MEKNNCIIICNFAENIINMEETEYKEVENVQSEEISPQKSGQPAQEEQKPPQKRGWNLSLMLTASFINAAFYAFSLLSIFLFINDFKAQSYVLPDDLAFLQDSVDMLLSLDRTLFLFWGLLYVLSFSGAALMWKMKKIGFHLYTCAQLGILAFGFIFIGRNSIALGDIMLTALFIVYYAMHLKRFN